MCAGSLSGSTSLRGLHHATKGIKAAAVAPGSTLSACRQFEWQCEVVAATLCHQRATYLQPDLSMSACRQFERQYIFVAATMPSEGKKSVAAELQHKFPGLLWLAGRHLHEGLSTIKWHWLPTDPHSWKTTFQVKSKVSLCRLNSI